MQARVNRRRGHKMSNLEQTITDAPDTEGIEGENGD